MHELSVAEHLVGLVETQLDPPVHVVSVLLRVGPLSGVVPQAMLFAYDAATAGTLLAGSKLVIEKVEPTVFCAACDAEHALPSVQRVRCPACDATAVTIVRGRELEVVSVEVVDVEPNLAATGHPVPRQPTTTDRAGPPASAEEE